MAHLQKFNASAIGHMVSHYERKKDEKGDHIKYSNQSIDTSRTDLNYQLKEGITGREFIEQRLREISFRKAKNVNIIADWVITAPEELRFSEKEKEEVSNKNVDIISEETRKKIEEQKLFFEATYTFLSNRYGEKNVVGAYVHLDEFSPHMHFAFMPIQKQKMKIRGSDKMKSVERLNANKVLDRTELRKFHGDLEKAVNEKLMTNYKLHEVIEISDPETGEIRETSKTALAGNKSVSELKAESAKQQELLETILREQFALKKANEELVIAAQRHAQAAERIIQKTKKTIREAENLSIISEEEEKAINVFLKKEPKATGKITKTGKEILVFNATKSFFDLIKKLLQNLLEKNLQLTRFMPTPEDLKAEEYTRKELETRITAAKAMKITQETTSNHSIRGMER